MADLEKTSENTPNEDNKPAKKKPEKPSFFNRTSKKVSTWWREMRSELRKVVWPTAKQVTNNSTIVVSSVIAVGIVVFLFDLGANWIIKFIISAFQG